MSRCSVGPLSLFSRVVVVQVSSLFVVRCSVFGVRCSEFGVLLVFLSCSITQNFQDLVLYDVHSLTNFRNCSIPVRFLFEVGPEVDVQSLCRSVVVVQTRRRCSGVVVVRCRCSLFGVRCSLFCCSSGPVRLPRTSRTVLYDVHSLATAVATERVSSFYTILGGRGLGLQCRRRRRDGRSLPVLGTVGNWFQPTFLA